MKRIGLKIIGKVQGVFFRDYVMNCVAKYLDVTGYVYNRLDGSVEVLLESEDENIDELIKEIKKGSPDSQVDRVEEEYKNIEKRGYKNFSRD